MSENKVFLCHNSKDKPEVRQIKDKLLLQQGIETWMDEKDIYGFDDWKEKIKENLSQINAVAVFLGSSGFGEWQKYEIIYTEEEINRRKQNKLLPLRAGLVILDSCKQTFQEIQNQYYHTPYGWLFNYHTVNLRESKAPVQELIGAITGQPWQVDDSSRELIKTQNTPQNHLVDSGDDLSSKTGVDYTQLENFLKAEQWKKADQETFAVMLQATGREQEGWLDVESIENFPCTHLSTIDQLWVKYSEGRFGFSVQNRILESVGWDYAKYGKCVGWRKGKFWNWLHYNQLTFSTNAPHGHLPALSIVAVLPAGVNLSLVVPSMLLPITRKFLTWSLYTNEIMRGLLSMWDANGYLKPQRLSLFSRVQTCKV